jgi:hypothetical protein
MRKVVVYKTRLKKEELFRGTFHGFFQSGNNDDGFYPVVVIEDREGNVHEYNTEYVKLLSETE